MKKVLPYNNSLKEKARYLRKNSTLSEVLLWRELKGKKLGYDFHRQKPIDSYIVDFYCADLQLAIEIDGESHYGKYEYDTKREERLKSLGVTVIRFKDIEIKKYLDIVINKIQKFLPTPPSVGGTPPAEGIK